MTRFDLNAAPALGLDGVTLQFRSAASRERFAEHIQHGTPLPSTGTITLITLDYEAADGDNVCDRYGSQGIDFTLTLQGYGTQGIRFFVRIDGRRRIVRTWQAVLDALGIALPSDAEQAVTEIPGADSGAEDAPEAPAQLDVTGRQTPIISECAEHAAPMTYEGTPAGSLKDPVTRFAWGFRDGRDDIEAGREPRTLASRGGGIGPLPAFDPAYVAGYRARVALGELPEGVTHGDALKVARFVFIEAELPEFLPDLKVFEARMNALPPAPPAYPVERETAREADVRHAVEAEDRRHARATAGRRY